MIADIAGWVAPAATMIAAMMTAANLGARITGWGFVVFVVGSLAWSTVGLSTGQANLLWTNGFLTVVNLFGVWRWLGRQAKYEDGGQTAAKRSRRAPVPTLFSTAALSGAPVKSPDGTTIATVVDAMATCDGARLCYVVVSSGGVSGVGERLHALDPARVRFGEHAVSSDLTAEALAALPEIEAKRWPEALPARR